MTVTMGPMMAVAEGTGVSDGIGVSVLKVGVLDVTGLKVGVGKSNFAIWDCVLAGAEMVVGIRIVIGVG